MFMESCGFIYIFRNSDCAFRVKKSLDILLHYFNFVLSTDDNYFLYPMSIVEVLIGNRSSILRCNRYFSIMKPKGCLGYNVMKKLW